MYLCIFCNRYQELEQQKIISDAHWQDEITVANHANEKALQVCILYYTFNKYFDFIEMKFLIAFITCNINERNLKYILLNKKLLTNNQHKKI